MQVSGREEFGIAAFWAVKAGVAMAALLSLAAHSWPSALVALPAVCLLVYMSAAICNNFGENCFLLKSGTASDEPGESDQGKKVFGFRMLESGPSEEEIDDE